MRHPGAQESKTPHADDEHGIEFMVPERPQREVTRMTLNEFRKSLTEAQPPAELTLALSGLWWDAKGDWTRAHESAQRDKGHEGSWVHAYLHRKEGNQDNAAYCYCYSCAGKAVCQEPLDGEWRRIVNELLG